jgi:hypothetical protein
MKCLAPIPIESRLEGGK